MCSRLLSYKVLHLIVLSVFVSSIVRAQCIATSANAGTTVTNVDNGGSAWMAPGNVLLQNDNYTFVILSGTTDLLTITDFGISLPADASICGIEVGIDKNGNTTTDNVIQIVKGGSVTGTNQATGSVWPTNDTDTYVAYGGDEDLWGTTWSVADIESSNFGVAVSATVGSGGAFVDHVTITVYYDVPLPVEFSSFEVLPDNSEAHIYWSTATEENNDYFTVLRSVDGFAWDSIANLPGAGDSYATQQYHYVDRNPYPGTSYYQIKQTDFDQQFSYSSIRSVTLHNQKKHAQSLIYPNPVSTSATILLDTYWINKEIQIEIYNTLGELVQQYESRSNKITIRRERLRAGNYICRVSSAGKIISVNDFIIE